MLASGFSPDGCDDSQASPKEKVFDLKTRIKVPRTLSNIGNRILPSRRRITSLVQTVNSRSLCAQEANDLIASAIDAEIPFAYVRPGGTESEGLYDFVRFRFSRGKFTSVRPYSKFFKNMVTPYSGVAFTSQVDLDYFCYRYLEASLSANLMGYGSFAPGALGIARLRSEINLPVVQFEEIEPVRAAMRGLRPWTHSLAGKKVLVVHPFVRTIRAQFLRKEEINIVKEVLPDFDLSLISPPVSLHSGGSKGEAWPIQYRNLADAVLLRDFDVALIGAGGYGAPLARAVSESGRVAVHTAGATQLIFGIYGKRWENDSEIASAFDSTWVRPFAEDLTAEIKALDGSGAYH